MTVNCQMACGYTVGNGAAINVPLGWYPDWVFLNNLTDGDKMTTAYLGHQSIPFSSGGTATLSDGLLIIGATSGARARLVDVLIYSGTFAAGDAAGFLIVKDVTGTFTSEAVYYEGSSTVDDATVTANVTFTTSIDTEVATETTTSALTRYTGSIGSAAIGFTIGSVVAEEAKLLFWMALRGDQYVKVG
jgi:hypothetical protein